MGKNALNVHWHFSQDTLTRSLDFQYLGCARIFIPQLPRDVNCGVLTQ